MSKISSTHMTTRPSTTVRLPLDADVQDIREQARDNGRRSLYFFLTAVLSLRVVPDVVTTIQWRSEATVVVKVPRRSYTAVAVGLLLWTTVTGGKRLRVQADGVADFEIPEAFAWLYGTPYRKPLFVTWAPDIIVIPEGR